MYNNPNFFYYNNPANYGYAGYGGFPQKTGLFSKLRGVKWGDFLNNTSKTLNVINQAIPIVYQVKPLITNAKTMFKIANIIKSDDSPKSNTKNYNKQHQGADSNYTTSNQFAEKKEEKQYSSSSNQPTFFL